MSSPERHGRSEAELAALRAARRERVQRHRAQLREEQLENRRAQDRNRYQERREAMTEEQHEAVRQTGRERQQRRREAMSDEQRDAVRAQDREQQRLRRQVREGEHQRNDAGSAFYLGPLNSPCPHCRALRFPSEGQNCCHKGKVALPALSQHPLGLQELFTEDSQRAKNFRNNIRNYNSAFSFASFGAQISTPPGRGTYCFRIHGQTYHSIGTLHPAEGENRQYGQLYIIEGDQAVNARVNAPQNTECRADVMEIIHTAMIDHSPYAAAYRNMNALQQEEDQRAAAEGRQPLEVRMQFKRGPDRRRYNEPTHNEVAAVFVGENGAPPAHRDIVVYPRDRPPQRISYMSSHIDPMCYPILFPSGDPGWHCEMQHVPEHQTARRTRLTMQQFYSYRLAIREEFSPIHSAGKLFQQYAVDAYVKTEGCRLYYIRSNQGQLRAQMYSGLMDHLHNRAAQQGLQPGVPVILPSSFVGSPRAMQQNYQDAMAIVAKYGKPDLFLTYTCNPKAREITENLRPGERAEYRPDLVARVFKAHLAELLTDIKDRHVLGVPVAHVRVIEFQKRGLPHCHMLIILRDEDKLRNREDIDRMISAEIPDPHEDPELYDLVKTCMIHGPCGTENPNSVCMENGVCQKNFPKEFRNETLENVNGYPAYRRRDNGSTVRVGVHVADNRFVVPYNSFLLRKYRAHINLEACASVKSVKYLFKYVYKGHDCANMEVAVDRPNPNAQQEQAPAVLQHDEVTTYLNCRYVSAPEAIWRLSEYRLHQQSHTIYRLAIHLPDQQRVYFREGEEEEAAARAEQRHTHLTAWFWLNREDPNARHIMYSDIPKHYVFNDREKKWVLRRRGGERIISRIYSVSPRDPEKFYLRLLLLHVPGAMTFEDLRTVNGIVAPSFREACIQKHLLTDDTEYHNTLTEASVFQMPRQLRSMFATICAFCEPSNARRLWNEHKLAMTEDLRRHHFPDEAENLALHHIDSILQENGTSCEVLGLPQPQGQNPADNEEPEPEPADFSQLNDEQQHLINCVLEAVESIVRNDPPQPRCYYVDAPGGCGKTFACNMLIRHLRHNGHQVASAAWTGIAATLLAGGKTVHSLFKLPVPVVENSSCNVTPTSNHAEFLRHQTLFIIDEASMIPTHALHAIDRCLQDITTTRQPFGGKIILLGGDFRQVLPIVPRSPPAVIIDTCLKRSHLWQHFQQLQLTRNMRARPGQENFSRWLLSLGSGLLVADLQPVVRDIVEVPTQCLVRRSLIEDVFGDASAEERRNRVILSPKNDSCLAMNEQVMQTLPGETVTYLSADAVQCDNPDEADNYPMEFINSLTPSGMPPHRLNLKVGCVVMLLRNLALQQGLCNGTRLEVVRLHQNCVEARLISGPNSGNRTLIPRVKLAPSDTNLPFILQRIQFPLRLAYSMTINKAQGQTFDKVGIYLPQPVFSHGQLYVAFSRAKALTDVQVKVGETNIQGRRQGKTVTHNVVYREVLT